MRTAVRSPTNARIDRGAGGDPRPMRLGAIRASFNIELRVSRCIASIVVLGVVLALAGGCKVDPPEDDKVNPDGGTGNLSRPQASAPDRTPFGTVAIRGRADGASRVVIKNEDQSSVNSLLPGGDFCVDSPIADGASVTVEVYAVAEDGNISQPASVEVAQDPGAPPPADPTCTDSGECAAEEDCGGNGTDDDCNGFKDECDPQCNGCDDDFFEPNDTPFSVPMVPSDTYEGLKICPCREDWYAFLVGEGGIIHAKIEFSHAEVDIDMHLYKAEDAEMHNDTTVAASADSDDNEEINYTSTGPGTYYLRVFAFRQDGQGDYELTVY
jgi:hypothetical protein